MNRSGMQRRRFLVASIAFSGAALAVPGILLHARAWADEGSREALLRIARLLYPHDSLPDDVYLEVLDQALSSVATNEQFVSLLNAAEQSLNQASGHAFMVASEDDQLLALKALDRELFFGAILASFSANLYNHPETWKLLGYGGASFQFGGYLGRGAGDIDWLPEAKS